VIHGDEKIINAIDSLLQDFIAQRRMKIDVDNYQPCWRIG
jgi:hypothetical protein